MSRNRILSRVYFVSLLSVCCMYLCWCVSLIPLQALAQPIHFVGRLKRIHTGEDVKGNAETTGYLHGFSFASEITCPYFNARQL